MLVFNWPSTRKQRYVFLILLTPWWLWPLTSVWQIYVTVGTEEKRQFLETTYGIPRARMFSSRNTRFEQEILRETGGKGVDCIINSLVGELLDASWRIVADGGTMVEIGKRDIIDRHTLAMEPFDRNCSFRAVDLSFERNMTEKVIARSVTLVK